MRSEAEVNDRHGLAALGNDDPDDNQCYGLASCLVCLLLLGFVLGIVVGLVLMAAL